MNKLINLSCKNLLPVQGYEPGVDCYKIMARGTLEAGDSQASAKFLETARNLPAAAGAAAAAPAPAAAIEEETAVSAEAGCGSAAGDGGRGGVGADGGGGEDASVQQQQQQEEEERRAPEATGAAFCLFRTNGSTFRFLSCPVHAFFAWTSLARCVSTILLNPPVQAEAIRKHSIWMPFVRTKK